MELLSISKIMKKTKTIPKCKRTLSGKHEWYYDEFFHPEKVYFEKKKYCRWCGIINDVENESKPKE